MSEIHFVGKTRYEDLTETGSLIRYHVNPYAYKIPPKINAVWN